MKMIVLMTGFFYASLSFAAGTMTCFTKEEPRGAKMRTQTPAPIPYTAEQASLDIKGVADPQIEYIALGDDQIVWVDVKDLRSGISAEAFGHTSDGGGVTLNMGANAGEFSLHCQTSQNQASPSQPSQAQQ